MKPSTDTFRNLDVLAVFCLAVLPDIANSIAAESTAFVDYGFTRIHVALVARSLQVAIPILLIMRLRSVCWTDYGFTKIRPVIDLASALSLCVVSYFLFAVFYNILLMAGADFEASEVAINDLVDGISPRSSNGLPFMIVSSFANGFAEELALRSYLLTRIREITSSSLISIILTAMMFAVYHGYQGSLGVTNALAVGITFGIFIDRFRRFWPVAIAHAILDVVPQLQ